MLDWILARFLVPPGEVEGIWGYLELFLFLGYAMHSGRNTCICITIADKLDRTLFARVWVETPKRYDDDDYEDGGKAELHFW